MKTYTNKHFILAEITQVHKIETFHDVMDHIGGLHYSEENIPVYVAIHLNSLPRDFLDLKNKIAGEFLQKFVTYSIPLAIIGDFTSDSKSLQDFIRESNRSRHINFHNTVKSYYNIITKWH